MTTPRLALVTGANKGIGFATTRASPRGARRSGARESALGRAAAEALQSEGLATCCSTC
jgi:NAD(P)-dependent dehydrogenase (short-subunit alcohol dehydrogenase family)